MRLVSFAASRNIIYSHDLIGTEVQTCATSSIGTLSKSGRIYAVIASPFVRPQLFSATLINFRPQTRDIAMQRTVGLLLVSIVQVSYASLSTRLSSQRRTYA